MMGKSNEDIRKAYFAHLEQLPISNYARNVRQRIAGCYLAFLDHMAVRAVEVKNSHIYDWLQTRSHLKANTYNLELFCLKSLLRFVSRNGGKPVALEQLKKKPVPEQLPNNIPLDQMITLCTPLPDERLETVLELRNQAIVEFFFSTGVRSIELRHIRMGQLSPDFTECSIPSAKGSRDRIVYVGKEARLALRAYLHKRGIHPQNSPDAWLFCNRSGGQLQRTALYDLVRAIGKLRLGFPIAPHMLRHTFGTEMLRACGCLRTVQEMMGHVCIRNTAIYCGLDYRDKLAAIAQFHPHGGEFRRVHDPIAGEIDNEG